MSTFKWVNIFPHSVNIDSEIKSDPEEPSFTDGQRKLRAGWCPAQGNMRPCKVSCQLLPSPALSSSEISLSLSHVLFTVPSLSTFISLVFPYSKEFKCHSSLVFFTLCLFSFSLCLLPSGNFSCWEGVFSPLPRSTLTFFILCDKALAWCT